MKQQPFRPDHWLWDELGGDRISDPIQRALLINICRISALLDDTSALLESRNPDVWASLIYDDREIGNVYTLKINDLVKMIPSQVNALRTMISEFRKGLDKDSETGKDVRGKLDKLIQSNSNRFTAA